LNPEETFFVTSPVKIFKILNHEPMKLSFAYAGRIRIGKSEIE
jgi:hypothetical protein